MGYLTRIIIVVVVIIIIIIETREMQQYLSRSEERRLITARIPDCETSENNSRKARKFARYPSVRVYSIEKK